MTDCVIPECDGEGSVETFAGLMCPACSMRLYDRMRTRSRRLR